MATEKQIAANKRNASRSTGPKSIKGKAAVARNALKHGLAGHGVVLPEEMAEQIQERKGFFWKAYKPDGPLQQWMFERICIESVRADVCLHQVIALRDEAAWRASESWDDDRALEAEELGARLSGKPELVQPKLRQSKHGTLWLAAQWEELERRFDVRGEWLEADSERAMDLLGLPNDGRVGVWSALTGDAEEGSGVRALIRDEVESLRRRLEEYLDDRDDRARVDAMTGLGADGPDVRRVNRFEGEILRRLRAWTRELRRLQGIAPGPIGGNRRTPSDFGPGPDDDWPPGPPPRDPDRPDRPSGHPDARSPDQRRATTPDHAATFPTTPDAPLETNGRPGRTSPRFPMPAAPRNRRERRAQAAMSRRAHHA